MLAYIPSKVICLVAGLAFLLQKSCGFCPTVTLGVDCCRRSVRLSAETGPLPPPFPNNSETGDLNHSGGNDQEDSDEDKAAMKANRFSQFAPSANLEADEFRIQLKENMKADLERRRREDPRRGNQPAKSYLDSL